MSSNLKDGYVGHKSLVYEAVVWTITRIFSKIPTNCRSFAVVEY